ncbi:MerR family transcriptional regulator [Arthrobacter russicus]|nr:MerR family transcriptional regulator [Arthrobacter russicus]MDN5668979.1 MerR family transcriptional regulator [Renibacterium salmoninarum]
MAQAWSISEVAKMARVSSRALRHYHQIGLLQPSWTAHNGYRYYEQAELLKLQRILLLRELGIGLETIAEVLDGQTDEYRALQAHHRWVLAERDRMSQLARTLESTMAAMHEGAEMSAAEMFDGFGKNPYAEEAIERWGKAAMDRAKASWTAMGETGRQSAADELIAVNELLAECQKEGRAADDPKLQSVIERHYRWIRLSWTPEADGYLNLGQMYVDDERFRAYYEKAGVNPEYLLAGMKVYAAKQL